MEVICPVKFPVVYLLLTACHDRFNILVLHLAVKCGSWLELGSFFLFFQDYFISSVMVLQSGELIMCDYLSFCDVNSLRICKIVIFLFYHSFYREKYPLINYSVILKYTSHRKSRINAWYFPFTYQFSKQWSGSLIVLTEGNHWKVFFKKSILISSWIEIYLICFNPCKLLFFWFSNYPISD